MIHFTYYIKRREGDKEEDEEEEKVIGDKVTRMRMQQVSVRRNGPPCLLSFPASLDKLVQPT